MTAITFGYDPGHKLTTRGSDTLTWDGYGRVTQDHRGQQFVWGLNNQLREVQTAAGVAIESMMHDADGQRVVREVGAGLVHCPTSNTFIGSGLFDMAGLMAAGHKVGLATDTGGGSSFSMLRTMAAAYEIAQLRGTALHPSQLLWLATAGSAAALRLDHAIGHIRPGMEADLIALDLASTPAIAQRAGRAEDIWEAVFPTLMMGDDRAIAGLWINGSPVG